MLVDSYRPVNRQEKLSIQVAEQIKNLIIEGKLKEGDRLPSVQDLCKTFNVSRTVIREAVSILETRGLLSSQAGSGTYVRSMQSEDVADSFGLFISTQNRTVAMSHLLEVRRAIEMDTVRLAAERASESTIQELGEILDSMCLLVGNPQAFADKDFSFHITLARASGNPLFEILLRTLQNDLLELIYVGSDLPGTAEEACGYHRALLNAIMQHEPKNATKIMAAHLKQTERVTAKGLRAMQKEKNG